MGRRTRVQAAGFHHVFTRGTAGSAFFVDDDDRLYFVALLERTAVKLGWKIHAYCLMTTHYHVVVETSQANLSSGMQRINAAHVTSFNQRWGRFGTLVSSRFGSRTIESEEYLSTVCEYVFLNPVEANLCEHATDWPWSGGTFFGAMSRL